MSWDIETDVVVVGGGGCGLVAAITAATFRGGVDVVLLEKNSRITPNSAIAGGYLQAAGTRYQKAAGVDDSLELMAEDIFRKNHGKSDPAVTLAVCRRSADVIHWFADELGMPLELALETDWIGHSRPRMHAHPKRSGAYIVQTLRERASGLPQVLYADTTPGRGLVTDDRGAVVGVLAGQEGQVQRIGCQRVVLAAGGFAASRGMLQQYIPAVVDATYIGAQTHTGEAIVWGMEVGAAIEHMTGYQGHGFITAGHGTRINPGVVSAGGFTVNAHAERFEREDQGYSEWAGVVLRQPGGVAVAIWDERVQRPLETTGTMAESMDVGAIARCATAAELAQRFGLDAARLARTLEAYNRGVAEGHDALGRTLLTEPLRPPYYAARITGALAHTQGGLKIDVHGRVLRPDGTPVPGLYAGGNTAVGLSGDTPDGYTSGNGLLMAYVLGRIIGEHVVASLRGEG
ncbi:MAG: FAD-binding protein [Chloroflexi bacterium]|nr:FAD-binding protein [Chloroflexota bacterium]